MKTHQLITDLQQIIDLHLTVDPDATLQTALTAYQTARTDGLCHDGAWEIALQVIQTYRSKNATMAG